MRRRGAGRVRFSDVPDIIEFKRNTTAENHYLTAVCVLYAIQRSARLCKLFELGIRSCDLTLAACRAEDGLFHSYNLLHRNGESIEISRLFPMLEGQVAVLGSGYLSAEESERLIRAQPHILPLSHPHEHTVYRARNSRRG